MDTFQPSSSRDPIAALFEDRSHCGDDGYRGCRVRGCSTKTDLRSASGRRLAKPDAEDQENGERYRYEPEPQCARLLRALASRLEKPHKRTHTPPSGAN